MKAALLIVDHGSRKPEAHVAPRLGRRAGAPAPPDLPVYVAHMELVAALDPRRSTPARPTASRSCVVHPFFLVPGLHAAEDVPRLVDAAALAHPRMHVRVTEATGSVAGVADLILATVPTD